MNLGKLSNTPSILVASGIVALAAGARADKDNRYFAPRTATAPVIDGVVDAAWDKAAWDSIPYTYIGKVPTPADFAGRYKVMWDSSRVYILAEIVDDSVSDRHADPLANYWDDDALEIFLDENHNGGMHQFNFSAWAYHISTAYDVVDYGDDQLPHLFNDHAKVRRVQTGHKSIWETSLAIYGEDYTLAGPNTPLVLRVNKEMGFTLAYCDNDGKATRDNFFGSVNTEGHMNNEGYIDASCFGSLKLVEDTATAGRKLSQTRIPADNPLRCRPGGFRLADGNARNLSVRTPDGQRVETIQAKAGEWYGASYPAGTYLVETSDGRSQTFSKAH